MTKASSKRKSKAKKPSKASSTNPSTTLISDTNPNKATTPSTPNPSNKTSPFTITIHHPKDHPPVFTIRPTSIWETLTRYRACEVTPHQQIPLSASITLTRPSHPGIWTAHILEIRASDPTHVYLRLYYYHLPSQLPALSLKENHHPSQFEEPHQRNPPHEYGKSELIATNEMEIVHAEHILAAAEVVHYRGGEDRYPGDGGTLWWRRAWDVVRGEWVAGDGSIVVKAPQGWMGIRAGDGALLGI